MKSHYLLLYFSTTCILVLIVQKQIFFMLSGLLMNTIDVHALHIFGIVLCTAYLYIMLVISSAMYELHTYLRKTFYFSLALFSMLIFTSIIIHLPLPPNLRFFDAVVFSFTLQY